MCVAELRISVFVINELNYILFLKRVEDSLCGLSLNLNLRIRGAERHIWL